MLSTTAGKKRRKSQPCGVRTAAYEAMRQIEWGSVVQPDQIMLAGEVA
jgi:hypothetical protein